MSSDLLMKLANVDEVQVIEQDKIRGYCCMCIDKNEKQFNVVDKEGNKMFVVVEDKDTCCRKCGCFFQADFDLDVKFDAEERDNLFKIYAHRKFCSAFTCCQCCRDQLTVKDDNDGEIGTIKSDYQCCACWPHFTVADPGNETKFTLKEDANVCANVICCGAQSRMCCGIRCYIVDDIQIHPFGDADSKPLEHVEGRNHNADAYKLVFPDGSSPNDKLLLVTSVIAVDYKMFSDGPSDEKMKD